MALGFYIFLIIFTVIIGGFIIGIIVWNIASLKKKPKVDTTTRVINLLFEWTNGHSSGWLVEQKKLPSKLTRVTFYPDDLSIQERLSGKVEKEVVIAKNVKTIPMGNLSSNVNVIWIFPNNIDELSKKLPNLELNLSFFDKKEEIKKTVLEKLNRIISSIPQKINKKYIQEIKAKFNEISDNLKNATESFLNISTKQLFDYNVLLDNFMFEMGSGVIEGKKASVQLLNKINFGAISSAERKRLMELYESQAKPEELKEKK